MEFPLPAPMLEFLILGYLDVRDSYGYEICQAIKQVQDIREPTLYPILKNLQKQSLITSYEEIHSGRRRKYYSLSPAGKKQLERLRSDWHRYTGEISRIADPQSRMLAAHALPAAIQNEDTAQKVGHGPYGSKGNRGGKK